MSQHRDSPKKGETLPTDRPRQAGTDCEYNVVKEETSAGIVQEFNASFFFPLL